MNLYLNKLIQLFCPKRNYSDALKWVFFLSDADHYKNILHLSVKAHRDGFRGGGRSPFTVIRPSADPKRIMPLFTILRYPFSTKDLKNVLMAPSAPIYNHFEAGALAKKCGFFRSKFSIKCLKTPFFGMFFQKFTFGAQHLAKIMLSDSSKNQIGRHKKMVDKVLKIFENPRPRENPRSAPESTYSPLFPYT